MKPIKNTLNTSAFLPVINNQYAFLKLFLSQFAVLYNSLYDMLYLKLLNLTHKIWNHLNIQLLTPLKMLLAFIKWLIITIITIIPSSLTHYSNHALSIIENVNLDIIEKNPWNPFNLISIYVISPNIYPLTLEINIPVTFQLPLAKSI